MQKAVKPFRTWRDAGQDNGQNQTPDFQCHHNSKVFNKGNPGKARGKGRFCQIQRIFWHRDAQIAVQNYHFSGEK